MSHEARLLPVRMLNEYVYCPRLFALEWVHGEWADSADTVRGQVVHRKVDKEGGGDLADTRPTVTRSVSLSDDALRLTAKIDLVESDGEGVVPVDYKQGRPAPNEHGAWDPERVQVCAQGLLLRAHGFRCDHGVLYFAKARRRVRVPFTDELVSLTLRARDEALAVAASGDLPAPLHDSPKCPRCSLVGLCLPDEHHRLATGQGQVRPLLPARDDAQPLYVQLRGGTVRKRAGEVHVTDRDGTRVDRVPLAKTSQVVVLGNVTVTTPLLHELAGRDIPVAIHGYGGRFHGLFTPASGRNALTRIAQHRAAADPARGLAIAQGMVLGKVHNQRIMLRRNGSAPDETLRRLSEQRVDIQRASDLDVLRGLEGVCARFYFGAFSTMIKGPFASRFQLDGRNRRPPRDPVNAMLSFVYACLVREVTVITTRIGLDPYVGFLHQPRHGRPALALDLMEEFRPLVADSSVVSAINNGMVSPGDFIERSTGVALTASGRGALIRAYEQRLDHLITHPHLGTRLSYRRIIEVQARLLGKVVLGELDTYPAFTVR